MSLRDFRCEGCRCLLAREEILYGQLVIKCYNCNLVNTFVFMPEVKPAEPKPAPPQSQPMQVNH